MSSRLLRITEEAWRTKARVAHYHVGELAKLCGVSVRTLERHIKEERDKCPHAWLDDLRMTEARVLRLDGNSAKEIAAMLGYKDASQFSKDFKKYHGVPPSQMGKKLKAKMLER